MDYKWKVSSYSSGQGNCVEVARLPHSMAVRDSTDQSGPVLQFDASEWQAFLSAIKDGRLA